MGYVSDALLPAARITLRYADLLVKDIPASDFAKFPKGIHTNHPAFCLGHLSLYPDKFFVRSGRAKLAKEDAKWTELFDAGKECRDDPGGKLYPAKDVIVARFVERHEAVFAELPKVSDEELARALPEPYNKMLPTFGAAAIFYFTGHAQVHLGQISAWRRIMGMPPVM